MSIRRDSRTGNWYFRARVTLPNGIRERISGTPGVSGPFHDLPNTKVGAQEAERRAIASTMTGKDVRPETPEEVPTIAQYFEPFMEGYAIDHKPSSKRDKRQRFKHDIEPEVGHMRLSDLRQEHVDAIKRTLLERGVSRKGANTTTSVLSSLVAYAVSNKVIADPELSFNIKSQDAALEAVAPDDVRKLVDQADERYRVAILLCSEAGLRIGEVRALRWSHVNELGRELIVEWSYDRANEHSETKGWERRTVPINDVLWSALRSLPRRGPLVFSRLDGKPITYDTVRDRIHEIYRDSGVTPPTLPWHGLRHTFGTELANSGAPVHVIRELMGHKRIETTLRYMHTNREQKRAAVLGTAGSRWAAASKTDTK
jgi:integrase